MDMRPLFMTPQTPTIKTTDIGNSKWEIAISQALRPEPQIPNPEAASHWACLPWPRLSGMVRTPGVLLGPGHVLQLLWFRV